LLRERIAADSPDPLVAAVSEMHGAVLVSLDSDFRRLAPACPSANANAFASSVASVFGAKPRSVLKESGSV
jgi:hypothetical protein